MPDRLELLKRPDRDRVQASGRGSRFTGCSCILSKSSQARRSIFLLPTVFTQWRIDRQSWIILPPESAPSHGDGTEGQWPKSVMNLSGEGSQRNGHVITTVITVLLSVARAAAVLVAVDYGRSHRGDLRSPVARRERSQPASPPAISLRLRRSWHRPTQGPADSSLRLDL